MSVPDIDDKIPLPAAFLDEMKSLFADDSEYEAFLKSYEDSPAAGVRLSPWKGSCEELLHMMNDVFSKTLPFPGERDTDLNYKPLDCTGQEAETQALNFSGDRTGLRSTMPDEQLLFSPVPWEPDGFYYEPVIRPGKHPFHEIGLYYIQEPSAMSAVPLLDPQPGERILDLCAAPGGKTTQIAGRMRNYVQMSGGDLRLSTQITDGERYPSTQAISSDTQQSEEITGKQHQCGLLISNEIHPARAKILSQNVERMGLSNVLVTNETPERLAARFPAYFDRILVDAPCSGEGMFRKHPEARLEWSPGEVTACAERQRHLLDLAASMLRPGGRIVYSTCTFSKTEDEDVAEAFLADHEDFHSGGCTRFFPHRQRGEGHFVAVLEHNPVESDSLPSDRLPENELLCNKGNDPKYDFGNHTADYSADHSACQSAYRCTGHSADVSVYGFGYEITVGKRKRLSQSDDRTPEFSPLKDRQVLKVWDEFARATLKSEAAALFPRERLLLFGEQLYLAPEYCPRLDKLKVLRPGLHLGTIQKGRLTPSHALALFLKPEDVRHPMLLSLADERVVKYFAGDVISCDDDEQGWTLVCVEGFSAGWGKASGGIVKNHYPKALRKMF